MSKLIKTKANFGTAPVFLTAISTILGAIMFLRFGYAVGNLGFWGTIGIIVLGHIVTISTAMALAEIATNQKVEGGGEYFIISRSFGLNIGGTIGVALYLSQAISVAFYIIAFGEAFDALKPFLQSQFGLVIGDNRLFSVPALLFLIWLMIKKGAVLGVKALYFVVAILFVSLVFFFIGQTGYSPDESVHKLRNTIENPDNFFFVFAIIFPAFTGMTAGVGLSGDLANPTKSIPLGTLMATIVGMVVYVFIAFKMAMSASPADLATDQLIMSKIAFWGPIIPIGLAAATISSAIGSFMVAPRTLQALATDRIFPGRRVNYLMSRGIVKNNEPRNATIVTSVFALAFVLVGDVNIVAEIISMFFMVTYGSLCLISFLQHFSADPAYRPTFKSKWYISLIGAVMCVFLMFNMNPAYAMVSIIFMTLLYLYLSYYNEHEYGMSQIFQGVISQANRQLQVFLQKSQKAAGEENWRPTVLCLSKDSFSRFSALALMKWISHRYGFGTYIHYIKGYYSNETHIEAEEALSKLIKISGDTHSNIFLDTLISPSNTAAIVNALQLTSISGKPNNMILFEFKKGEEEWLGDVIDNYGLITTAKFDLCILASSDKDFGFRREIHVWITKNDYDNANLMILLSYIIIGHSEWKQGKIKIFALYNKEEIQTEKEHLLNLIQTGRLPISASNVNVLELEEGITKIEMINKLSMDADLTLVGIHKGIANKDNLEIFKGFDAVGNVLFVNALTQKAIK
jgi:solute carrier family 12 (sodium/potassium/chloride transporter), member 2